MVAHEAPAQSPEKQTQPPEVPKSREIFTGDINDAVITVQQITGFEITPEWWASEVGNEGTTEEILDRFDTAFEKFVHHEMGFDTDEEANVLQHSVEQEADNQLAEFDATVPEGPDKPYLREEFIEALASHLNEKYYPSIMTNPENQVNTDFELTEPEERLYTSNEEYRFLVHVPLGDVAKRGDEIGHGRGNTKLMTSLISQEHQGTFLGEGGIIVAEPSVESVSGIASIDVGGEIQADRKDAIDDIIAPAPPTEYNQIDMAFDGTQPVGVLIKQTPDGEQLGSAQRNSSLIAYAKEHNLPVVTIEVQPAEALTKPVVDVVELLEGQGEIVTVDLPYSETEFLRTQVLRIGEHNTVYHADGASSVARTMKVNQFGEATQVLSTQEQQLALESLRRLSAEESAQITEEDVDTVIRAIEALRNAS